MALTFQKQLSTTDLLSAFNNNIVEFTSTLSGVTHCIITFDGEEYKIYPRVYGGNYIFWHNFKRLFSKLINDDMWVDDVTPSYEAAGYKVITDVNLSMQNYVIDYEVFNSSTSESTDVTVDIIKNVLPYKTEFQTGELYKFLDFDKVSVFSGFPFDVQMWVETAASNYNITRFTKTTTAEVIARGIGRLYIDIGDDLETDKGSQIRVWDAVGDISWDVKSYDCDGVYLKWYVSSGGWAYFLFNPKHKETVKSKNTTNLYNDFDDNDTIISPRISQGRDKSLTKKLHATGVEQFEVDIINTIIGSPKVLLYTGTKGVTATEEDWLEVELKTTQLNTVEYSGLRFNTSIEIDIPQTQMLL